MDKGNKHERIWRNSLQRRTRYYSTGLDTCYSEIAIVLLQKQSEAAERQIDC